MWELGDALWNLIAPLCGEDPVRKPVAVPVNWSYLENIFSMHGLDMLHNEEDY